jgi:hypothetical protein
MKQLKISLADEVRGRLDAASAMAGHSLGEEIRQRLDQSFAMDAIDQRTGGLTAAIADFASLIEFEFGLGNLWSANPIARATFADMIAQWLEKHNPASAISDLVSGVGASGSDDPKIVAAKLLRLQERLEQNRATLRYQQRVKGE